MARYRGDEAERAWAERIREQAESGVAVAQFCRRAGCSEASFYYWKRKLGTRALATSGAKPAAANFLAITVADSTADSIVIEIELPNQALVRIPTRAGEALLRASIEAAGQLRLGREDASC